VGVGSSGITGLATLPALALKMYFDILI